MCPRFGILVNRYIEKSFYQQIAINAGTEKQSLLFMFFTIITLIFRSFLFIVYLGYVFKMFWKSYGSIRVSIRVNLSLSWRQCLTLVALSCTPCGFISADLTRQITSLALWYTFCLYNPVSVFASFVKASLGSHSACDLPLGPPQPAVLSGICIVGRLPLLSIVILCMIFIQVMASLSTAILTAKYK